MRRELSRKLVLPLLCAIPLSAPDDQAEDHHMAGVAFHLERRLDEAAHEYDDALRLVPPREPTADEFARVLRLAPRLFVHADEPFPLKDVVAIVHPSACVIAYHFVWEDDVDFPDDNDPSDHEVAWVIFDKDGNTGDLVTLFHGRVVDGGLASVADARSHGMRARVNAQWGKHGLMPAGWESHRIYTEPSDEDTNIPADTVLTLLEYNELTWKKLSTEGTRGRAHPLAVRHGWPSHFRGDFASFTSFTREIDIRALLKARHMVLVSRWNSATLARRFLLYNFRPKLEWPE